MVLPIGTFAESSGTFVNAEGRWQSWVGAARLVGESRPGWKVLRVLANLLNVPGIDFVSSEEIREALRTVAGDRSAPFAGAAFECGRGCRTASAGDPTPAPWVDIPPYQVDPLVRGSESLSKTKDGHMARAVI